MIGNQVDNLFCGISDSSLLHGCGIIAEPVYDGLKPGRKVSTRHLADSFNLLHVCYRHYPCYHRNRNASFPDPVKIIIKYIIIKKHLCSDKITAGFNFFPQMLNIRRLVNRLHMALRITGRPDAEIFIKLLDIIDKLRRVAVIGCYGAVRRDVPAQRQHIFNLFLSQLLQDGFHLTPCRGNTGQVRQRIYTGFPLYIRGNPDRIAEYTLISKDKGYVQRAKAFRDNPRDNGEINTIIRHICERFGVASQAIGSGSVLCSDSIGDGSSREQAASNQKILGGWANLAMEYSTKRYRSNCINWGLIPLQTERKLNLKEGEYLFLANVRSLILSGATGLQAYIPAEDRMITLSIGDMTDDERKILVAGSMINYYRK